MLAHIFSPYKGAGDLAVEVEVADVEIPADLCQMVPIVREDTAGQPILGVVGNSQGLVKVLSLDNCQPEDFLLGDHCIGGDVCNDSGLNEVASFGARAAPHQQAPFLLADFDVVEDGLVGVLVADRPQVVAIPNRATLDLVGGFRQLPDKFIIDVLEDNDPGTSDYSR